MMHNARRRYWDLSILPLVPTIRRLCFDLSSYWVFAISIALAELSLVEAWRLGLPKLSVIKWPKWCWGNVDH